MANETATDLARQSDEGNSAMSLILNPTAMAQMMVVAELMASARVSVPEHLQGNKGDCLAVVLQAARWHMDPFAVARQSHQASGGVLAYDAQLMSAVLTATGATKDDPEFEFIGDWDKILGNVRERKNEKGETYWGQAWNKSDEAGLGVIVRATLRRESQPREVKVMMSQCYPRFSSLWGVDPKQQICYVGIQKFSRRHAPGALLGVYTKEEMEYELPDEIEAPKEAAATPSTEAASPVAVEDLVDSDSFPQSEFEKYFPQWKQHIENGKSPDRVIALINSGGRFLTEAQQRLIRDVKPLGGAIVESAVSSEAEVALEAGKGNEMRFELEG